MQFFSGGAFLPSLGASFPRQNRKTKLRPSHCSPPPSGNGESQSLKRRRSPTPVVALHGSRGYHSLHPPSTGSAQLLKKHRKTVSGVRKMNFYQISFNNETKQSGYIFIPKCIFGGSRESFVRFLTHLKLPQSIPQR